MATNTYVALQTQTLGSAAASVTFSSISQSYTDLVLVMNVQCATGATSIGIQYNGDTTNSNYSFLFLSGNGSAASSGVYANQATQIGLMNNTVISTNIGHIMNYSNTTTYKTYLSRGNMVDNQLRATVGMWRNTAAITSLTLFPTPNVYNFTTGSTFTLYGIAAA
jgi:hypothetical protein